MNDKEQALSSFNWLNNQRIIFVLAFLVGSIGIIVCRIIGLGVVPAVAFAFFVMLSYVLFGATKKYLVRPDILGDNSYYLGFLYTLVSLAYTLYSYASNENEIDAIIHNFGIALSTTLIGLVFRVYFNQTKEEPAIYEKAIQMSLADQASSLIGETARIRNDMTTLRTSIQQSIKEGVDGSMAALTQSLSTASDIYKEQISKNSEQMNQILIENLNSFQSAIASSNATIKDSNETLLVAIREFKNASNSLTQQLQQYATSIQKIESVENVVSKNLIQPLDKFHLTLESVRNKFIESATFVENFINQSNEVSVSLKELSNASLANISSQVNLLSQTIASTTNQSESTIKEFANQLSEIKQGLENSVLSINNSSDAFHNLQKNIVDCVDSIPNELSRFQDEYEKFNQKILDSANQSQDSVIKLQQSLITLANKLVDGINKNG